MRICPQAVISSLTLVKSSAVLSTYKWKNWLTAFESTQPCPSPSSVGNCPHLTARSETGCTTGGGWPPLMTACVTASRGSRGPGFLAELTQSLKKKKKKKECLLGGQPRNSALKGGRVQALDHGPSSARNDHRATPLSRVSFLNRE